MARGEDDDVGVDDDKRTTIRACVENNGQRRGVSTDRQERD